jgi:hypothetical protein
MLLPLDLVLGTSIFDMPPSGPGGGSMLAIIPFLLAVFAFVTVVIFLWVRRRR